MSEPVRKALILAAGEGTRLRPLTLDRPKPMLPVGGKPVFEHIVNWLRHRGIRQLAINLHHKPERVIEYFGDGRRWQVQITYSVEERILGTAGAAKHLQSFFADTFLVVYGDVLSDLDLGVLLAFHRQAAAAATLALYHVPSPWECGIVALDAVGGIVRFVEKPARDAVFGDLANAGILVAEPAIIDFIPPATFFDFGHDPFPILLGRGVPMFGRPIAPGAYLLDMGSLEKYRQAEADLVAGRWTPVPTPPAP